MPSSLRQFCCSIILIALVFSVPVFVGVRCFLVSIRFASKLLPASSVFLAFGAARDFCAGALLGFLAFSRGLRGLLRGVPLYSFYCGGQLAIHW